VKRKDLEVFGVLGLSLGTIGFVLASIAFIQTQKLTKSLKEKVMLEERLP
jgi:hypothetical protein